MRKPSPSATLLIALLTVSALAGAKYGQSAQDRADEVAKPFKRFAPQVRVRSDDKYLYVESNGMPDHRMMVGITAWQQQVPLPQQYTGKNAWQIPLFPTPAKEPRSAKTGFFRGAIALAANGIPIFNPIKNDGRTDTFLAGELDEFGGHSGRGDDYHYHLAPLVLQEKLGKSLPLAYALDGYAIYGLTEPDGTAPKDLDAFNGHESAGLGYHYHATKAYPYLNGGFHGEVVELDGQVDPQPRASSPRPATSPLRGAKVIDFKVVEPGKTYSLEYKLDGEVCKVNYRIAADGSVTFDFVSGTGTTTSQTFKGKANAPRNRPDGDREPGLGPPPGPRKPWFVDHAKGLDTNADGIVTRAEVTEQCKAAFKEYADGNESISVEELPKKRTVKNEIGGFMKVHAKELDRNSDGKITEAETIETMLQMFDKQDRDGDGKLSGKELEG